MPFSFTSTGGSGEGTPGAPGADGAGFGIYYLGNYNPNSGYVPDIAVVRGSDGQLYLAKASGQLGDPVGNTAQWEVWIPKGADGTNGTNGADALWNYTGEYNGGASYAVGDIATYDGQLWYRYGANGGNVGDTPSPGFWNLLAAKGADGSDGIDGENGITVAGSLDDLTDVTVTGTPSNKQLLVYDTATSQWINADPIDAGGIAYKEGIPATPTSTGQVGELAIDGINAVLYVCTSTNNWQKVSLNAANFTNIGGFN